MKYTYYDPNTGQIQGLIDSNDPTAVAHHLQGRAWIQGEYHFDQYYIDQGQAQPKPPEPRDGRPYDFDWSSKTWQLNLEQLAAQQRDHRNQQLSSVDRVNPVWFATLTVEQQQQLAEYRQALLAVPQQSGFPESINWPSKPAWL